MKRNPRTGHKLDRTTCNGCGKTFPGRVLPADRAYCPKCEGDPESKAARFAPGRNNGTLAPNLGTPESDTPEGEP
jgi:hypothetical protein